MQEHLSDPLFKGCTRPAMIFGVPIVPFGVAVGIIVCLSFYLSIFLVILLLPVILVMRMIAKTDDQQFRLLGKKLLFRLGNSNRSFWKSAAYSPLSLKKPKTR